MLSLRRFADSRNPRSLASRLRLKRISFFYSLLSPLPRPVRILDLGGTEIFWEHMGFAGNSDLQIMILNTLPVKTHYSNLSGVEGDATDLTDIADDSFDVSFSNSVIEHLGSLERQQRMAFEHRRVAKRYFVQTPNKYFPIEPHFLIPGFQYFPFRIKVALVARYKLSWFDRIPDHSEAERFIRTFRLLSFRDLNLLFPGSKIHRERFLGLTKSFMVLGGW